MRRTVGRFGRSSRQADGTSEGGRAVVATGGRHIRRRTGEEADGRTPFPTDDASAAEADPVGPAGGRQVRDRFARSGGGPVADGV
jgi:hypothetical protein